MKEPLFVSLHFSVRSPPTTPLLFTHIHILPKLSSPHNTLAFHISPDYTSQLRIKENSHINCVINEMPFAELIP